MAGTAILRVNIISDARNAAAGMNQAEQATGRFQSGLSKLAKAAAITWVTTKVVDFGKEIYGLASEAEQNLGAVDTVFGKSAAKIKNWSADSADAVGMSTSSYQSLANSIGGSLKSAYKSTDEMADKTKELIGAGADLSSVFGGDAAEAAAAMGSALRGEMNPLERFGIFLNMNAVNSRLAADGNNKLTGAAADAAKKQTIQNMIMEQAAKYQGNFAREADTAAGAQQRATAKWENAKATLGQALLPIMVQASAIFAKFSEWVSQNAGLVTILAVGIAGLAVAIGVVNAVMALNPFSLIAIAIGLFIAALVVAYNKLGWFKDFVNVVWAGIKTAVGATVDWLTGTAWPAIKVVWEAISKGAKAVYEVWIKPTFESVVKIIKGAIDTVANIVNAGMALFRGDFKGAMGYLKTAVQSGLGVAVEYFKAFPGRILAAVGQLAMLLINKGRESLDGLFSGIKAGWEVARAWIGGIGGRIENAVGYLKWLLWNQGNAILEGFLEGLRNAWRGVQDFVGGIADWIARNKGPISYDKKILQPAGAAIMGGLLSSMKGEMPALRRFLGGVSATIAGVGTAVAPVKWVDKAKRLAGGSSPLVTAEAGTSGAPVNVKVEVNTGVGDPVAIGREVEKALRAFFKATGGSPSWL